MTLITQDDVLLILKLLQESTFDELRLETGEFKLLARKHGKGISLEEAIFSDEKSAPPLIHEPPAADVPEQNVPSMKWSEAESRGLAPQQALEQSAPAPGLLPIRAPMLGTFYRTPKPGAPPYVEVGSWVKEEDPVCIIEVMKLFNTVKAGTRGRIAKICAEQGQMVEFQQTLFLVEKISEEKDLTRASRA